MSTQDKEREVELGQNWSETWSKIPYLHKGWKQMRGIVLGKNYKNKKMDKDMKLWIVWM